MLAASPSSASILWEKHADRRELRATAGGQFANRDGLLYLNRSLCSTLRHCTRSV